MDLDNLRHTCTRCGRKWYLEHERGTPNYCQGLRSCPKCYPQNLVGKLWWWDDTNDFVLYVENVEMGVYKKEQANGSD